MAVYFLANRLLPLGLADRAEWEIRAFFAAWILATLSSLVRPHRRAWFEALAAVAFLCCAVVTADILTLPQHPVRRLEGDTLFVWFDTVLVILAVVFAVAARKVLRYEASPKRRRPDAASHALPARSPRGV